MAMLGSDALCELQTPFNIIGERTDTCVQSYVRTHARMSPTCPRGTKGVSAVAT
jgi:hypothetical protein